MKRRDFLKSSSLFSVPVFLNGMGVSALTKSSLFSNLSLADDRILVLIYLGGGNDGLNTVIPVESYDALLELRPQVVMPENSLLTIDNGNALHSAMTGFHSMYQDKNLGIIQGVAYPDQNRSHFRSSDIWNTGSDSATFLKNGWLGRFLQDEHPIYPEGYPNPEFPDPLALTIDYSLSESCQGNLANFSLALANETSIASVPEGIQGPITNDCYGSEYKYVIDTIAASNAYGERIIEVFDKGTNISTKYGDDNALAQKLKLIARLISGGSTTKIYIINQGGYDTHSNQVGVVDPTLGIHADLLRNLSDGVAAFQEDISLLGYGDKVIGMTYSEFGRRIRSNESFGTDHGTAAPMFVFGQCVNGGIIGKNPELNNEIDSQAGLEMQYDFRSVYASVLIDWFGVEKSKIGQMLFEDYQHLPIVDSCNSIVSINPDTTEVQEIKLYPNPVHTSCIIELTLESDYFNMQIFSILGSPVKTIFSKKLEAGEHQIPMDVSDLIPGQYVMHLSNNTKSYTKRFVKI